MSVLEFFNVTKRKGDSHERSELELKANQARLANEPGPQRSGPWVLSPYVRAGLDGGTLYLGFGSLQKKITDRRRQELLLSLSHFWMTPSTVAEAFQYLVKRAGASESEAAETVDFLLGNRYLIRPTAFKPGDRYGRHALFYALAGADPEQVQKKLSASHVTILGCGGIGNQVACALVSAGVGRITLVDQDSIEPASLSRQFLFAEEDVGQSKAEVLRRELLRRDGKLAVEVVQNPLKTDADFFSIPDCNLIVVSDSAGGLVARLNAHAIGRRLPYIDVGFVQDVAVWGPLVIPGETGCHACHSLVATEPKPGDLAWSLIREINGRYQAPSFAPVNLAAASHASLDILRFLGGFGEIQALNQRIGIWTHDLHIETQSCSKNPTCLVCAKASS